MKRRIFIVWLLVVALSVPAKAEPIKWVDFSVPYESLKYAMDVDIATAEKEKHISWIEILAVSGCRTGGKCTLDAVKKAARDLEGDKAPEELLGNLYQYYPYYKEQISSIQKMEDIYRIAEGIRRDLK